MNKFSVIISAPSGAGKSTLISRIMKKDPRFSFSVSTTTRSPREGEKDGINYYFKDRKDFEKMIENDEFLEWAEVHGNLYGTSKKEVDRIHAAEKIPLFDIDVQGAKNIREKIAGVFVFIVPPSMEELKRRLLSRSTDSQETIELRIRNASAELAYAGIYDYVIVNDSLETAENDFFSVMRAEEIKTSRMIYKINDLAGGLK
ncbi:MAG TPA: guanylate kinase [Spirochaetota bacterium]|nr:guanylate kinase [Spirochaetota bacterium]HPJ14137.1 guanylate kinase [Spirochaetota bacterium]HPM34438.1 guanylate kinase [Spirochaetota bacterium]